MRIRYNQKITTTIDADGDPKVMRKASRKEIDQYLDQLEHGVAIMPDSFVLQKQEPGNDSMGRWTMQIKIDTIMYIKNKNKIKYIKEHNISLPYIRFY